MARGNLVEPWYLAKNGQRVGPFHLAQMKQMATSGLISPIDMIWQKGTPAWISAGKIPEFFPAASLPTCDRSVEPSPSHSTGLAAGSESPGVQKTKRSPYEIGLAIAFVIAFPFWCFNDWFGTPYLSLTGLTWILAGVHFFRKGRFPSFEGPSHGRPMLSGVSAFLLLMVGFFFLAGGVADLVGKIHGYLLR